MEAKRAIIPDAENSAEQIVAIQSLVSHSWPASLEQMPKPAEQAGHDEDPLQSVEEALLELPPELQLNSEQTRLLRAEMEIVKEPLAKARELLKGVTTDAIRNTAALRARIKDGMTEIATQLAPGAESVAKRLAPDGQLGLRFSEQRSDERLKGLR